MKISHINYSDNIGGASKAAMRISKALNSQDIDADLVVLKKVLNNDQSVIEIQSKYEALYSSIIRKSERILSNIFYDDNDSPSFSLHPSKMANYINQIDSDIVHLHWINGGMLSISDIAKIKKPKIWTLHDMWPFCATEHYAKNDFWKTSYSNNSFNGSMKHLINNHVWNKKNKMWKEPFEIVAPSKWMANCAKESTLFRSWPVSVIKNPIDTEKWFPSDRFIARKSLGLPLDTSLILFGAIGGTNDPRKGFKYLERALKNIQKRSSNIHLVIFGNEKPIFNLSRTQYKTHNMGFITETETLRNLYTACDVFVLPSLQDNLPNTGLESLACGTPLTAFNCGGMEDIVMHKKTGYLAEELNSEDLENGIHWVLDQAENCELRQNARKYILDNFSFPVIAKQYKALYQKILSSQ